MVLCPGVEGVKADGEDEFVWVIELRIFQSLYYVFFFLCESEALL